MISNDMFGCTGVREDKAENICIYFMHWKCHQDTNGNISRTSLFLMIWAKQNVITTDAN